MMRFRHFGVVYFSEMQLFVVFTENLKPWKSSECKFSSREYEIDKEYDKRFRERQALFIEETKTRKSTMMTFITTYDLKQNEYSGRIQNVITSEDLLR